MPLNVINILPPSDDPATRLAVLRIWVHAAQFSKQFGYVTDVIIVC